jgi:uncharacterized protein YqhQ
MMRAPRSFAVVLRRADGSLLVRERAMPAAAARGPATWPFLRGVTALVESLRLGNEALRFSAEQLERDAVAAEQAQKNSRAGGALGVLSALGVALFAQATRDELAPAGPGGAPGEPGRSRGSVVMLVAAIAFFVALPQASAAGLNRLFGLGLPVQSAPFQAITGAFKLVIIVGYMLAIRRVPEIRRMFQYHGAEHKTISTYEAGEALTVENARARTTLHPRCGTTFLVMVALVSAAMFMLLGASLPRIVTGSAVLDNLVFFAEKLPFLPVLVAVTFELQRLFARFCTTGPLRVLLWPGFLVQRITTGEPDEAQLEVALASLRATLFRQEQAEVQGAPAADAPADLAGDVVFPSYAALLGAPSLRLRPGAGDPAHA